MQSILQPFSHPMVGELLNGLFMQIVKSRKGPLRNQTLSKGEPIPVVSVALALSLVSKISILSKQNLIFHCSVSMLLSTFFYHNFGSCPPKSSKIFCHQKGSRKMLVDLNSNFSWRSGNDMKS